MTLRLIEFLSETKVCPESPDASPPPPHLMRSGWTRETSHRLSSLCHALLLSIEQCRLTVFYADNCCSYFEIINTVFFFPNIFMLHVERIKCISIQVYCSPGRENWLYTWLEICYNTITVPLVLDVVVLKWLVAILLYSCCKEAKLPRGRTSQFTIQCFVELLFSLLVV